MAPEPLRDACNAERAIQIRLELDLAECRQLQHWLTHADQVGVICNGDQQDLQGVLVKLTQATEQAVRRMQCPVCHEWFAQGTVGRSGQYCTAACKQKAYRQRQHARKRQWGQR